MGLDSGTKLGPYEILSPLGAGGMGEVYRARDTRLDREVAIKVLPEALARDAERIARFQREAKVLASLNHPNIAAIYGFEETAGKHLLVMELAEGDTLAETLSRGAMPVEDALRIAKQMAEALEAAHDKGIIHRDLKPANVMIRKDGTAKVLDFGLAKAMAEKTADGEIANSTTITAHFTRLGVVLGTIAYMSPEQANGRALDTRTDIWSFGVILYECLSGSKLFQGTTVSESIGAILHSEPAWSMLPSSVPPTIRHLLRRCLTKDRNQRLQAIADARVELSDSSASEAWSVSGPQNKRPRSVLLSILPWVACAVLAGALLFAVSRGQSRLESATNPTSSRFTIQLPPGSGINWFGTNDTWGKIGFTKLLTISRDGRSIVYTSQRGDQANLNLKVDQEFAPQQIVGADGARGAFLSPDGQWVGFLTENKMQKVRLPGGAPQPICEVNSSAFDATWLGDGIIVFSNDLGLWRVRPDDLEPEQISFIDMKNGVRGHLFPNAIAGTNAVIFTASTDTGQHAAILSLDDLNWHIVKQHASNARYVPSGHLVFARGDELFCASFDPSQPDSVGTEVSIAQGVHTIPGQGGAVVHLFATSHTGVLVFAPQAKSSEPDSLVWVDLLGNEETIVEGSGYWMHQRLSPDGHRVLFNRLMDNGMFDLYIYDIRRDQIEALTSRGQAYDAEWSPDGKSIGFAALDDRGRAIFVIPSDFSDSASKILEGADARHHFSQWSPDGSTLMFFDRSSNGGVWTARADGSEKLRELINTPLSEGWAMISPDGQLITYVGFQNGLRDVYVQEYPKLGPRVRVSVDGGGEPRWAPDSRTLYFREQGKIYRAVIKTEPRLGVEDVKTLPFNDVYDAAGSGHQHYDLSHDGTKFLMVKHGRRYFPDRIHVIENWTSELRSP